MNDEKIIDKAIEEFIKKIEVIWQDEPLDMDETEHISMKIMYELNKRNGNI